MISYSELAKKILKVPEQRLIRMIRHAMQSHFFYEPKQGYVAHSALSAGLVTSSAMRSSFEFLMQTSIPMMPALIQATEKHGQDAEKAENATMGIVLKGGDSINPFEIWQHQDPEKFSGFMEFMKASVEGTTIQQIVDGYNWKGLGEGTVVDVRRLSALSTHPQTNTFPLPGRRRPRPPRYSNRRIRPLPFYHNPRRPRRHRPRPGPTPLPPHLARNFHGPRLLQPQPHPQRLRLLLLPHHARLAR